MKKLIALCMLAGMFLFVNTPVTFAEGENPDTTEQMDSAAMAEKAAMEKAEMDKAAADAKTKAKEIADAEAAAAEAEANRSMHQILKSKFIEGGPGFMSVVIICLILGLALCIERILYLNLATTNTVKLLNDVESALKSGGVDAAKEVCRNTKGPVASIFYQGLDRADEGIDMVEKSVVQYGGVQMGLMEKGLSWISLFIALAPMLGFFGTVIGMIGAFDAIAAENNISPAIVAEGIGVALITTVSGLAVAMILQVFYNYIVAKVDSLVNDMEDASITLVDLLLRHKASN